MSLINEYRSTEGQIKELQERLAALKVNPQLQKEIEFEEALRKLLATYGKSLRDVINILDPQSAATKIGKSLAPKQVRAPRQLKVYKNPHTGETVETKGGNHGRLNEWKREYGADIVKGWVQS
ncbi:histone-like nucleoid-structuring protein, MvaT/MvaU family [Pseudomonas guariconensis]|uniref:histone-like nucleoid-structuring protein, MvaT/MvaU family n=1 Tax=Pseudomonas guariconensis TaxID=1288410 RepID=UPI003905F9AF